MARQPVDCTASDENLYSFFCRLTTLRKKWFSFWNGKRRVVWCDDRKGVLLIEIYINDQRVFLGVNRGDEEFAFSAINEIESNRNEYWGDAYLREQNWILPPKCIAFWF